MNNLLSAIFSAEFIYSIIRVTTPLLLAGLAALVANKGGVLHIAFEAIMLTAAFLGVVGSAYSQSLIVGLLAGIAGGVLIALLLGYFNLVLRADRTLTGIALNTFASGGTIFMLYVLTKDKGLSTSLNSLTFPMVEIPIIKNIPYIGTALSGHNLLTYVSFIMVFLVYVLLYKTAFGLRIRTVGESENAASSVGINVSKVKFATLVLSAIIASLGGVYMSMGYLSWFARDMVAGRGFMGIAAQNLGGEPLSTMFAALFFGLANALSNVLQTLNIPAEFVQAIPYIATLLGLMAYSKSLKKDKTKSKSRQKLKQETE